MDNGASSYRRFLDGDESAFNEIMEELFRSLVFFINGYVHDIHAAEDIAIDAFLYWEGESYAQYDLSKGFCVKGEDTAAFLEGALEQLGLTRREANEFIVYWLPLMEQNLYNIISFQTDIYTDNAKLMVDPAPDTLIRVFMAWQSADEYVELEKQDLTAPDRTGFTVVEWGGTEIK